MEENVIGMPDSFFERLNKKNGFADDTTAAPVDSGITPVAADKTIPQGMPDSFFEKLNNQQHYADTNNWAENYKRYIPQAEENPSAWDNIKNNFFAIKDASEASMYGGLELMSRQGEKSGNANFANFIKAAGMYYGADPNWLVKNMQENEAQSQEELKRVWLDPKMGQFNATDMFADPKSFFQTQLPQMLGGSATLMAAGMGIAKGVQTGVMAIGAAGAPFTFGGSAVAAGFIGGAVASAISRPIESLMEGYGAFDEAYSELAKKYPNATHQQLTDMAMPVFNKTFDENMQLQVLDAVQLGLSIIPVTAWGKGSLSGTGAIGRMARRADMMRQRYNVAAHIGETAFQMGTGGWEEGRQMQITNEAINKYVGTDKPTSWYDMLNTKEGQSAVSGGTFMGGMMESPGILKLAYNKLTGVGDDIKTKPYEDIKQKQTALFYGNIAKSVNEGTTNEMMQAINKFGRSGVLATVETDDTDSRNKSSIAEAKRLGDEVAEQVDVFSRMKQQYPDISEKGLVRMFQNNALIRNNTKALKTLSEDNVTDTPIIQRINAQNEALNKENNDIIAGKDVWETPSHEDPFADPDKDKEADIPFDSVEEVEAARLKEIEALQQMPTDGLTDEQMHERAESLAEINSRYEDLKNRLTEKINDAKGHYENQRVLTEMLQNNIPVEGTIQKAYGMHYDFVTQDGKTVRFYNQATHDVVDDNDFNGSAFLVLRKAEQGLDGTYKDEKGNYLFRSVLGDKDHAERIEVHTTDKDGNDKYLGNVAVSNAEDYNIARDRAKAARMEKLEGEDGEGEGFSVSDEQLSGVKTTSNEQAAEAQSYGFRNAYHALNSVNKYFDADYTDYANIPKEDLALVGRIKQEEAASATTTTTTTPPPDSPPDSPPPSEPDTHPAPPTPPPTPPPAPQSPSPATAPSGTTSSTDSGNAGYERTERSFDKVNVGDNITHNGKQGKVFAKVRPKGSLSQPVVLAKDAEGKVFRVSESEYKGTERGESDNVLKTNGKLVSYRNDVGKIVVDEENNVIFEGNKSSVELGKTTDEEFAAKSIGDIGISYVNENSLNQAILVDNTVYVKGEQQELVRINYDKNGNVVSYTYKNSKGQERTNRNYEAALDVAIQKNNQEFDKSRKGASDEVKQRDEEHISGVVKAEYGDSIGYILETMPDEVYDTFDLMESGVTSLEKDAIQYMVLRTIEALADARKRIEGSNATKKEKGSALSMIEKFEKDLNKYYGKLDQQGKVSAKDVAKANTGENNKGVNTVQDAEQEAEQSTEPESATNKESDIKAIESEAQDAEHSKSADRASEVIKKVDRALSRTKEQKARDSGEKTVDGVKYNRQENIVGIIGNAVKILFSKKDSQDGKYAVVELSDLQPSHRGGIVNEGNFIPEAQPRDRGGAKVLKSEAAIKGNDLKPEQLGDNNIAYFGAPVINQRGEVIQGNGRVEAIDYYYSQHKGDPKGYREMIASKARLLGIDEKQLAGMKTPVLVRMVSVTDNRAIELGNYTTSDLEDINPKGTKSKSAVNRLSPEDAAILADSIGSQISEDSTLKGAIRNNSNNIIDAFIKAGVLREDEKELYIKEGEVTPEGVEVAYNIIRNLFFEGADKNISGKFDDLPFRQREAIEKSIPATLGNPQLRNNLHQVIDALYNQKESGVAFGAWRGQSDMFNEGKSPNDVYSKEVLDAAKHIEGLNTQKAISTFINTLADKMKDKPATLFEGAKKGVSFEEAIEGVQEPIQVYETKIETKDGKAETVHFKSSQGNDDYPSANDLQQQGAESAVQQSPDATGQIEAGTGNAVQDVESLLKKTDANKVLQIKYPRKAIPTHELISVEHAGHEAPKRVTSANKNEIMVQGYGTMPTTSFLSRLIENGRLKRSDFKGGVLNIRLTEEFATKLLRENEDLFVADLAEPKAIAEAYHKAKTDGSNPELVSAVEKILNQQPSKQVDAGTGNAAQSVETNPALTDVESTAKALEGKNIDEINKAIVPDLKETLDERINSLVYKIPDKASRWGIKNKQGYTYSSKKEASRVVEDGYNRDKYSIELSRKKQTSKSISESYHKAKSDGSNPELVKAVEDLINKNESNRNTTTEVNPKAGVSSNSNEGNSALRDVGGRTNTINGFKFTDTPSLSDKDGLQVTPLPKEDANIIKQQMFVSEKMNSAKEGVSNEGGGWYSSDTGYSGNKVLYNVHTGEAVELGHKKGGRMGGIISDFILNNERKPNTNETTPTKEVSTSENKIKSWIDKWEELKKENDNEQLDLFYNKVKVALNGYAQGKGVVDEFTKLKSEIEQFAKERKAKPKEQGNKERVSSNSNEGNSALRDVEAKNERLDDWHTELKRDKNVFWHGSPSGDMRGGEYGLHIGTHEAAKQALEARIGVKADGTDWDGTEEYGKTKLAGKETLKRLDPRGFLETGFNSGKDVPEQDYFPSERKVKATFGDKSIVPETAKPNIQPVRIKGEMSNSTSKPHEDFRANGLMKGQIKRGTAKRGYYYENVGEDAGSVSAVVPNKSHLEVIESPFKEALSKPNTNETTPTKEGVSSNVGTFSGESNSIKYQIEESRDEPLASVNPALAEYIRQRMQRLFPSVALFSDKASFEAAAKKVSKGVTFSSAYIGAAIKNLVYVDAEKALQHTEIHEYAHIYWDALPADHPLKTALLDKFGGNEEATIDAIGRAGTIIMENELDIAKSGFFEKWLKKFWAAVKGVFTSKSIEQAFAERLLTNADEVTEENITSGVVKYMKMKSSAKYSELSEKAVKGIEKIIGKKISSLTFPEYYKHISTEIKPNDFKQWKMLSPQKFLEKMYGIVSPVSTLSPSNKAVFMKQYREYLDDYNWAENNVWTRFASGSMTLTVKEIEDLYMEAYKRKSYGTKDAVNFLADLYSKAVMYKNMQQEIKGDTFNKPFAKMSFDMMSGHEITDLSGSEFVSGKYSLLSPDRVKETILQGREKLYREVQRNATIKEDTLKNDFDVIWKNVKDLKSDLRKIVDKTGTYFIDRNSSAYKALRGGTAADRALADLLDMHYKYESAYGGLSMEKGKYRVPVARMDFGGLAKKFGFKEGMRRYFAKPSKYDNVIIDVRSLGLSKPLMTLKQARQEMVKGSNAVYPFQMLKLTKKVDALTKEAYKQFNSGRHANGDIVTTEDLSGSRYGVSFVKDDESSEDLKVSMMLYHYANIENESYDLLSPYSMYIQKYLGRKDKPNMLKWVKMLDDDLIKGESPTSNLGVYAKYVQALTNYTHWLQLGFNIAGMPFNAFAGFAQSVREIGFRNTLRGLRRVIGSLTVGGGAGVVNAKAISIMEKLHIVSLSKDLEMSVTSKIGKGISKIAFLPVSFVEYINHAYSFIGAMDEAEWERIKALPVNASAEDYTKAMGGNERIDELHTLTQKINGAYSKYSRRGINKTAEGRALMQFKNWLPDVIFAHLTVSQLNEAGEDLYGEYQSGIATSIKNTVWNKTIIPMFKDKSIAQAKKNWETLSEHERIQVGKAMRQLVILGGMALWIASLDDRDDKELKRMLRRAMGDVTYIFDVSNMQFLFDNTVPVFGTIKNLLGLVAEVFSTATGNPSVYEKRQGSHMRGDLKLPVMIENQTPVVNKISKLVNEGD